MQRLMLSSLVFFALSAPAAYAQAPESAEPMEATAVVESWTDDLEVSRGEKTIPGYWCQTQCPFAAFGSCQRWCSYQQRCTTYCTPQGMAACYCYL